MGKRERDVDGAQDSKANRKAKKQKKQEKEQVGEAKLGKKSKKDKKSKRSKKEQKNAPASEPNAQPPPVSAIEIEPMSPDKSTQARRVSVGDPGETPKCVHEVPDLEVTPLAVREQRDIAEAEAAAKRAGLEQQRLVKHANAVAEKAEKRGGFVATKGGLALVGLVARTVAEHPAMGVKNLYKEICATLGLAPGRGKAPASREVRKIIAALKEYKSLEAVMTETKSFSNVGRRELLVQKKLDAGPKSKDGSCKLFIGNLSWSLQHEGGEETIRNFFRKCGEIKDIMLLKTDDDKFSGTGFVEFETPHAAQAAIRLHGTECAERPINIHYARARAVREHQTPVSTLSEKPEGCTTVFVANLSFEIDERAVRDWAGQCGSIVSIRWLNDKQTGRFKGCGYIEFGAASAADAVEKMVQRNGSMFQGRAVRVDYAEAKAQS